MSKRRDIAPALGFGGGHGCRVQGVSGGHWACPAVGHPRVAAPATEKDERNRSRGSGAKIAGRQIVANSTRVRAREADRGASIRSKPGLLDRYDLNALLYRVR